MSERTSEASAALVVREPPQWVREFHDPTHFLASEPWFSILESSLGAKSIMWIVDEAADDAMAVPIFHRGPFRVAYPGFPSGASVRGLKPTDAMVRSLAAKHLPSRVDEVRWSVSAFLPAGAGQRSAIPSQPDRVDTAIPELAGWTRESLSSSLRRNVRRAERSEMSIKTAATAGDGSAMYGLYASAVARNLGSLRYTESYFRGLAALPAASESILRLVVAKGGRPASMIVAFRHGDVVSYLHGGYDPELRSLGPGDLAVATAIQWAADGGARAFDMMTSPVDQPNLVRYKEKWGGVSTPHLGMTQQRNRLFAAGLSMSSRVLDRIRRSK